MADSEALLSTSEQPTASLEVQGSTSGLLDPETQPGSAEYRSPTPAETPAVSVTMGKNSRSASEMPRGSERARKRPRVHTAAEQGAPARQYLNSKVVPHLLKGMKKLAREQPDKPLEVLGQYLIEMSRRADGEQTKDTEGSKES